MLSITILTLHITSNVISRIQAEEQEERKAQINEMQTPVNGSDSVFEALKVQKRDTLNIVPESYVEQTDHADKSQSGKRLISDMPEFHSFDMPEFHSFDMPELHIPDMPELHIPDMPELHIPDMPEFHNNFSLFDAPANKTGQFNFFGSRTYQSNNVYAANGGKDVLYGSEDVLIGNTVSGDPNTTNVYGPTLVQVNNAYLGNNENAQYGASVTHIGNSFSTGSKDIFTGVVVQKGNTYSENPKNKTLLAISVNQSNNTYSKWIENNKDALKPVIHQSGNIFPSSNDSEAGMNTKNNTEGQVDIAEQNATDSQGNSSSTNYDSSSHVENKTLHTKEKEAYADKHSEPNRQMSLSSNVFYSLSYSLIILLKYSQF